MAKLAPLFNEAQFIDGIPANGAKLFTYVAGSSTKQATYTDEAGLTPQSNPILLDSRGEPSQPIWLSEGASYKFVFSASDDTDPPTSPIRTIDNVTGINDATVALSQWVDSGITPTYISANSFSLPGDQTSQFQVNRRVKLLVTAGTVYGYISASVYAALTTVTVVLDSGTLDSGLSNVQLGLITPTNTSLFQMQTANIANLSITNAKLANGYINDLSIVTLDPAADYLAIADGSDSGNKKKALLPAATDTAQGVIELLTSAEYNTGTDTTRALTAAVARANNLVQGSRTGASSNTAFDYTGIPSWAKLIIFMLDGISTNGTSKKIVQIGDSGGIENTGYAAAGSNITASAISSSTEATGFPLDNVNVAASANSGVVILAYLGANIWTCYGAFSGTATNLLHLNAGSKTLSGTLDRVRLTMVNGTDVFDAGSVNIIYG